MALEVQDLDRIIIQVGMSRKTLREVSDTQFTAWLRSLGARGAIRYTESSPGVVEIALEERVRILNELVVAGVQLDEVSEPVGEPLGVQNSAHRADLVELERIVREASIQIETARGLAQRTGEIDSRINLRQSLDGVVALLDAAHGAIERALR